MSGVTICMFWLLFTVSSRKYLSELKGLFREVNFSYRSPKCSRSGRYCYFSNDMKDNVWPISAFRSRVWGALLMVTKTMIVLKVRFAAGFPGAQTTLMGWYRENATNFKPHGRRYVYACPMVTTLTVQHLPHGTRRRNKRNQNGVHPARVCMGDNLKRKVVWRQCVVSQALDRWHCGEPRFPPLAKGPLLLEDSCNFSRPGYYHLLTLYVAGSPTYCRCFVTTRAIVLFFLGPYHCPLSDKGLINLQSNSNVPRFAGLEEVWVSSSCIVRDIQPAARTPRISIRTGTHRIFV